MNAVRGPAPRPMSRARLPLLATAIALAVGFVSAGCVSISRRDGGAAGDAGLTAASTPPGPSASAGATRPFGSASATRPFGSASASSPVSSLDGAPASLASGQRRIGFLSLDERNAFVATVSASIREAAESQGVVLVSCDPAWTRQGVLDCARRLAASGVHAVLSFQPFTDLAPEVCVLLGDVPVVGIVFDQGACQVSRLRIDQARSGRLAGEEVGRFAAQAWDCETSAYVSLESSDEDPDGRARMAGYRAGYEEHCPLPQRVLQLDGADRLVTAQSQVTRRLDDLPGKRIVIVGLNEDAILGAMAGAAAADREDQVWFSGQLADASIRRVIACDERYIASVAQFPERFGSLLLPPVLDALEGRSVPPVIDAPLAVVTADNVRELYPDTPPCDGEG